MRTTLLAILAALTASAQDRQSGKGVNFYSIEKEAAFGATLAAQIEGSVTPIDSAAVRNYVNQIGSRLAAQIKGAAFPYTFTVLAGDSSNPTHEPVAVPGGYIFVPSELILAAKDEAEFAGMLAHAMVHVSERHYTRQATRGEIANQSTIPLIFMGGWTGYGIRQANSVLAPAGFLIFQRGMEAQADVLAVGITSAAGFDPSALIRYIGREQVVAPGTVRVAFATLPTAAQRITKIDTAIQALPPQVYPTPDPDEFAVIQAEVRRLAPIAEQTGLKDVANLNRPALKKRPN